MPDLEACGKILDELKIFLLDLSFLPTTGSSVTTEELTLGRDVLEQGAFWSIKKGDITFFDRYFAQLKHYYHELSSNLPKSPYQNELIGAHLLSLLSQNKMSEFHIEIEIIDPNTLYSDPFIKYPVLLEQHLIEGNTNKFFSVCNESPAATYQLFLNILVHTVRRDIADCIEKSFVTLPAADLKKVLFANDDATLKSIVESKGWILKNEKYSFYTPPPADKVIPSESLIKKTMTYAKDIERII